MEPTEARDLYRIAEKHIYFNHASIGPLNLRQQAAINLLVADLVHRPFDLAAYEASIDRLRHSLARLINGAPEGVVLTHSTAHGMSLLASGLELGPGDNVVIASGEFPTAAYPWLAQQRRGVEVRVAEPADGRYTPELMFSLVDDRTKVVSMCHVQFWNGYRADIAAIGAECRRRGVISSFDVIQSIGAMTVDVEQMDLDFIATGGQKWMMAGLGTGFAWFRPDLLERLTPPLVGINSVVRKHDYFAYDLEYRPDATRFEESLPSPLAVAALQASVDLLLEVGPREIQDRVLELSGRLAGGLAELGMELLPPWPRTRRESSGIVSFRRPGVSAEQVLRELNAAGVAASRRGDFIRLSPHFTNTEQEVDEVLAILAPQPIHIS